MHISRVDYEDGMWSWCNWQTNQNGAVCNGESASSCSIIVCPVLDDGSDLASVENENMKQQSLYE